MTVKPINPNTTLIPAKPGSLIVNAFLISLGLLMSHEVFAQTYILGDEGPGGGIVYSIDGTGEHGLEAQPRDYNDGERLFWHDAITAAASYNNPDCPTNPQLTPVCWHLPTKTELELLYEERKVVGGLVYDFYWSSTEYDRDYAWTQNFLGGKRYIDLKKGHTSGNRVRAVRAF